jgi:predicted polyphosphate/ATP-dependent NAD kinase
VRKIGFLVNPIAGMGGRVGLKGTDGEKTLKEAIRKGAKPVSPEKGLKFLEEVQRRDDQSDLITAPGSMGADIASQLNIKHEIVGQVNKTTTPEDTVRVTSLMKQKVDLIAFCGGDGTARDVLRGTGQTTPVLGIPSGVKVYSSVFAINPFAAAASASSFLHDQVPTRLGEVVDVDEEAFRKNRLSVKLFGYLPIPDSGPMIQSSKSMTQSSEDLELDAIADHVFETISPSISYVLGPGSTVERIARRLGVAKTLFGVDVARGDGTLLGKDVDEQTLSGLVGKGPVKIIVSPIGGQGFLFGRGNQQISAEILRMVGVENVMVVASRSKIESLRPRRLLVDSGDDEIDKRLRGYARVVSGYREEMVVKME